MSDFEKIPNLNGSELHSNKIEAGVNAVEKTENKLKLEAVPRNTQDENEARMAEIARLEQLILRTKDELNREREKLDLPLIEEDPPSVTLERDRLEKLKGSLRGIESREGGEDFKENDLIVSDDQVGLAKKILEENKIPYTDREYTKRQILDAKNGSAVPGEFILTIFDPEHSDRPAPFEIVKKVFELIRDSEIAVRYGKKPGPE